MRYLFIFLLVVVIGSFSGTTNGGINLNKLSLFFINFKEELNKFLFQHNVKGVNIIKRGSSQIELNTLYALIVFSSIVTFLNIIISNYEVYKSWKVNNLKVSLLIILTKPISKIKQFFSRNSL